MKNIHERALEVVGRYFKSEAEVITILQELDCEQRYREKNCRSLFDYATRILKLSESVALTFINVGRKAKEVPALQAAIVNKEISVPTARKIVSVITAENSADWIEKAKTLTQPNLEREVARVNPKAAVQERAKFITAERMRLEVGVSEALMKKLRRVQDLESSSKNKAASLEDVLETMVEFYLDKRDPVRIEKRVVAKSNGKTSCLKRDTTSFLKSFGGEKGGEKESRNGEEKASSLFLRTGRPKSYGLLKREVLTRDEGQCTEYNDDGTRCPQARHVHVHHVFPKEFGGLDTAENLTTLCSHHHRQVHERLLL